MTGQYEMDIYIQGVKVLNRLDVFERVERDYVLGYRFPATVTAGTLQFRAVNFPRSQVSTFEIRPSVADAVPPETPVLKESYGSFNAVVLDWHDSPEGDLSGYDVFRTELPHGVSEQVSSERNLVSRFIDFAAVPGSTYSYEVTAVDVYGNSSPPLTGIVETCLPHEASQLTRVEILADTTDLELLNEDIDSEEYIDAVVIVNDTTYTGTRIRYRGNVVRKLIKKSYKVNFTEGDPFRDQAGKVNLVSEFADGTLLREHQAYRMFRDRGIPTPDSEPVHLSLNGMYLGTYLLVEHVDERFLENHNQEENTVVYKCFDRLQVLADSADYMAAYTKETFENDESWGDIISFIEMLNATPQQAIYDSLVRNFEIDNFILYYGNHILQGGFDWIWKNFFLARNMVTNRWQIYPWDLDLSFGPQALWDTTGNSNTWPIIGATATTNVLAYRMMQVPALRNAHLCNVQKLSETLLSSGVMADRFQDYYDRISFDASKDWRKWGWEDNRWLYGGVAKLSDFVAERGAYLQGLIPQLYLPQTAYINELMAANATFMTDEFGEYEDWIEIYNPGPGPLNLAGYYMTDDFSQPYLYAFPDTTLGPLEFLVVWADEDQIQGPLHAGFKLNRNGEKVVLHRQGSALEAVDLVIFPPQGDDISWGRRIDGRCPWDYVYDPTPGDWNVEPSASPDGPPPVVSSLRVWPNPARTDGVITLTLSRAGAVDAGIFDVQGRRVRALFRGDLPAGATAWRWDGRDERGRPVSGGIYWVRASTTGEDLVRKVIRTR